MATTLFRPERVPEGLRALEGALAAEPKHPPTLGLRAFHAISTGDEVAAQAWMARVRDQPRTPAEQVERLRGAFRAKFGRAMP